MQQGWVARMLTRARLFSRKALEIVRFCAVPRDAALGRLARWAFLPPWVLSTRSIQGPRAHKEVSTTRIYTRVLNKGHRRHPGKAPVRALRR